MTYSFLFRPASLEERPLIGMRVEVADFLTGAEVIEQVARLIFFSELRFAGIQPPDFDTFFIIVYPALYPRRTF